MTRDYWLQRRLMQKEALDFLLGWPVSSPQRTAAEFLAWHDERFQTGDELWWYDMGGWSDKTGENDFAIVHNGETAFMYPLLRN